jgi:hypothetical protein
MPTGARLSSARSASSRFGGEVSLPATFQGPRRAARRSVLRSSRRGPAPLWCAASQGRRLRRRPRMARSHTSSLVTTLQPHPVVTPHHTGCTGKTRLPVLGRQRPIRMCFLMRTLSVDHPDSLSLKSCVTYPAFEGVSRIWPRVAKCLSPVARETPRTAMALLH